MRYFLYVLACGGIVALILLGMQIQSCRQPAEGSLHVRAQTSVRTDTVFIDRPILRRDTVTVARPVTRTIYRTVTDTVRDCFARPRTFHVRGLVSPTPLRFEDGLFSSPRVELTYFDPAAARFQQDTYRVPDPEWRLWADVGGAQTVLGPVAGLRVGLRWKRLSGHVGYQTSGSNHGVTFGVRLRLFTMEW